MPKKTIVLLPETERILEQMGLQIKYARLRRKLTSELVAERAGISRATLVSIEKGSPSVAMGCYAAVLHALNYMDKDLLLVAKDDELGRKLQDLDLPVRKRAPRRGQGVDKEKKIFVFADFQPYHEEIIGTIYVSQTRGKEFLQQKQTEIEDTQKKLSDAQAEEDEQYEQMKKRIKFLYESGGDNGWAALILEGR